MEFKSLIKKRASVRKFMPKRPDWRLVVQAIDAARYVPLAGNMMNFKFVLVSDKDKIEKIKQASQQGFVGDVHYVVVMISDDKRLVESYEKRGEKFARQQSGAAIQNFLLALTDLGLATCWVGYLDESCVKRELNIPEELVVEAIFPIGKAAAGAKKHPRRKKDLDNILYFEKWKNKYKEPKTLMRKRDV